MVPPPAAAETMTAGSFGFGDWETYVSMGIFIVVWLLIFKSKWPCLPIGRPTSAILGASLMVMLGVLRPGEAYDSIEADTLLLLLGLFVILGILESKGVVGLFTRLLMHGNVTPRSLLVRVSILSGVMSAFIMNDGAAIVLSLVVVKLCEKYDLPIAPYMIGMATSANIGSAATPLGNPKNMVVHSKTGIPFVKFVAQMAPPALLGLAVNTGLLLWYFGEGLRSPHMPLELADTEASSSDVDEDSKKTDNDIRKMSRMQTLSRLHSQQSPALSKMASLSEEMRLISKMPSDQAASWQNDDLSRAQYNTFVDVMTHDDFAKDIYDSVRRDSAPRLTVISAGEPLRLAEKFAYPFRPVAVLPPSGAAGPGQGADAKADTETGRSGRGVEVLASVGKDRALERRQRWEKAHNVAIGCTLASMYLAFLFNFPLGWSTMMAAVIIIMLERSADGAYDINWQILIYIIGMFVVIAGVNKTPFTGIAWKLTRPLVNSANPFISVGGFCLLVVVLSFIFTSIPTVLLVSPHLDSLRGPMRPKSWLLLAWSVTLCGNITIFGSVAGVIASQNAEAFFRVRGRDARTDGQEPGLGFMRWFKFAFPSTLIILALGAAMLIIE